MLQIAEAGKALRVAKRGIIRPALILRIVHHQFQSLIASGCGEDRSGLKQAVGDGISKVGPLDVLHCGQD